MTDLREAISRAIHESLSKQDVMAYLDGDFECGKIADAVIAILPDAEALAEALDALQRSCCSNPVGAGDGATYTVSVPSHEALVNASTALANYRKGTGREG